VVVLTPAYQSLHAGARAIGCQVVDWPLVPREGRWELDLKALKDALQRPARLVVVNFPNNPTGFLPTPAEWQELLGLVSRAGATLFSDEMYRLLEHDPAACLPSACERPSGCPDCAAAGWPAVMPPCWRRCNPSRITPPSVAARRGKFFR
jgi:aspartate/methionine/tyrosine aminotransferase